MLNDFVSDNPLDVPQQKIFLSIDIVDSTLLKTLSLQREKEYAARRAQGCAESQREYVGGWAVILHSFLAETQQIFDEEFYRLRSHICGEDSCKIYGMQCLPPDVWKYIGDEIVFMANLQCVEQPYCYVKALSRVIYRLNKKFQVMMDGLNFSKTTNFTVQFKGAAWVAGFPVTNTIVELYTQSGCFYDYIGPSMDLGFRLSKFATASKLILSTSLVRLLYDTQCVSIAEKLPLFSSGYQDIKGVKGGNHPLFWICVQNLTPADAKDTYLFSPLSLDSLTHFFAAYYQNGNEKPFIFNPKEPLANAYQKQYADAVAQVQLRRKQLSHGQSSYHPSTESSGKSSAAPPRHIENFYS